MIKNKLGVKIIALGIATIILTGCSNGNTQSKGTVTSTLKLFDNLYTGTYTGNLKNNNPDGKGSIKLESDTVLEVEGTWKDGNLNGDCTVTYSDGSVESGKMIDNNFDGKVTKTLSDGTYSVANYSDGQAKGAIKYYDKNNKLIDYDWYYQQIPIKELIGQVQDVDYSKLIYFPNDYIGKMIKTEGVVESVYETNLNAYVTIKNSEDKVFVCKCKNMRVSNGKQAIAQTFENGEKITVYGYFLKTGLYKNFYDSKTVRYNQYTSEMPYIEVVYGYDVDAGEFDPLNASFTYEDVAKNPYGYAGMSAKVSGKVNYMEVDRKKGVAKIKLETGENQFYYVNFKYNKKTESLPSVNDNLTVNGKYYGLYKEEYTKNADDLETDDRNDIKYTYEIYPYINAKEVIINK